MDSSTAPNTVCLTNTIGQTDSVRCHSVKGQSYRLKNFNIAV